MAKKSMAQISGEVNGKRVRDVEAKSGSIIITFADGSQLWMLSEKPITVEYGMEEEVTTEAEKK